MRPHKTEKAKAELRPGVRTLGQRERTLLLLADGQRHVTDLNAMFGGEGRGIAAQLLSDGYLAVHHTVTAAETPPAPVAVAADQFDGKRSLATKRMFLFDIVERMFVRRSPELANAFRDSLRSARDRESMLTTARAIIAEIEATAGFERADSISERISMLLPVQE